MSAAEQARIALAELDERLARARDRVRGVDDALDGIEAERRLIDPDAPDGAKRRAKLRDDEADERERRDRLVEQVAAVERERQDAAVKLRDAERDEARSLAEAEDGNVKAAVAALRSVCAQFDIDVRARYVELMQAGARWTKARAAAGEYSPSSHPALSSWATDPENTEFAPRLIRMAALVAQDERDRERASAQAAKDNARRALYDRARVLAGPPRRGEHPLAFEDRVQSIALCLENGEEIDAADVNAPRLPDEQRTPGPHTAATEYDVMAEDNA